VKIYQ